MAAVEVIYLLAAVLWIGAALTALCLGCLVVVKFRARRRRINRLLDALRMPLGLITWWGRGQRSGIRWHVNQMLVSFLADALDIPRKQVARGSQRRPRKW
jgi:hypothetical protein